METLDACDRTYHDQLVLHVRGNGAERSVAVGIIATPAKARLDVPTALDFGTVVWLDPGDRPGKTGADSQGFGVVGDVIGGLTSSLSPGRVLAAAAAAQLKRTVWLRNVSNRACYVRVTVPDGSPVSVSPASFFIEAAALDTVGLSSDSDSGSGSGAININSNHTSNNHSNNHSNNPNATAPQMQHSLSQAQSHRLASVVPMEVRIDPGAPGTHRVPLQIVVYTIRPVRHDEQPFIANDKFDLGCTVHARVLDQRLSVESCELLEVDEAGDDGEPGDSTEKRDSSEKRDNENTGVSAQGRGVVVEECRASVDFGDRYFGQTSRARICLRNDGPLAVKCLLQPRERGPEAARDPSSKGGKKKPGSRTDMKSDTSISSGAVTGTVTGAVTGASTSTSTSTSPSPVPIYFESTTLDIAPWGRATATLCFAPTLPATPSSS